MHTIAVAGTRGGTGKTTLAVSMAHVLADRGYATLVVDLDPTSRATLCLGAERAADPWTDEPIQITSDGSLVVRAGGWALNDASAEDVLELLRRDGPGAWDVRILDLPPQVHARTVAAVRASDLLLVPLPPQATAEPVLEMCEVAATRDPAVQIRCVLSQVTPRWTLGREVREEIEAIRPGLLFRAEIPLDAMAARAPRWRRPVTAVRPYAPASRAIRAVTDEMLRTLQISTPTFRRKP